MCKLITFVSLLLLSFTALARPVTIQYTFTPDDCDGTPVAVTEYSTVEIYIDTVPIPAADSGCRQAGAPPDAVPAGARQEIGVPVDGQVIIDMDPGDYFMRGRVMLDGVWSQLGLQINPTIGAREPRVIILNL